MHSTPNYIGNSWAKNELSRGGYDVTNFHLIHDPVHYAEKNHTHEFESDPSERQSRGLL